jgi:hypothetical protein
MNIIIVICHIVFVMHYHSIHLNEKYVNKYKMNINVHTIMSCRKYYIF